MKLPCFIVFQEIKFCNPFNLEVEYIAVGTYYAQVLWMKHTLLDYDLHYDHIKIFCDNASTIHITKNVNQHSRPSI